VQSSRACGYLLGRTVVNKFVLLLPDVGGE